MSRIHMDYVLIFSSRCSTNLIWKPKLLWTYIIRPSLSKAANKLSSFHNKYKTFFKVHLKALCRSTNRPINQSVASWTTSSPIFSSRLRKRRKRSYKLQLDSNYEFKKYFSMPWWCFLIISCLSSLRKLMESFPCRLKNISTFSKTRCIAVSWSKSPKQWFSFGYASTMLMNWRDALGYKKTLASFSSIRMTYWAINLLSVRTCPKVTRVLEKWKECRKFELMLGQFRT